MPSRSHESISLLIQSSLFKEVDINGKLVLIAEKDIQSGETIFDDVAVYTDSKIVRNDEEQSIYQFFPDDWQQKIGNFKKLNVLENLVGAIPDEQFEAIYNNQGPARLRDSSEECSQYLPSCMRCLSHISRLPIVPNTRFERYSDNDGKVHLILTATEAIDRGRLLVAPISMDRYLKPNTLNYYKHRNVLHLKYPTANNIPQKNILPEIYQNNMHPWGLEFRRHYTIIRITDKKTEDPLPKITHPRPGDMLVEKISSRRAWLHLHYHRWRENQQEELVGFFINDAYLRTSNHTGCCLPKTERGYYLSEKNLLHGLELFEHFTLLLKKSYINFNSNKKNCAANNLNILLSYVNHPGFIAWYKKRRGVRLLQFIQLLHELIARVLIYAKDDSKNNYSEEIMAQWKILSNNFPALAKRQHQYKTSSDTKDAAGIVNKHVISPNAIVSHLLSNKFKPRHDTHEMGADYSLSISTDYKKGSCLFISAWLVEKLDPISAWKNLISNLKNVSKNNHLEETLDEIDKYYMRRITFARAYTGHSTHSILMRVLKIHTKIILHNTKHAIVIIKETKEAGDANYYVIDPNYESIKPLKSMDCKLTDILSDRHNYHIMFPQKISNSEADLIQRFATKKPTDNKATSMRTLLRRTHKEFNAKNAIKNIHIFFAKPFILDEIFKHANSDRIFEIMIDKLTEANSANVAQAILSRLADIDENTNMPIWINCFARSNYTTVKGKTCLLMTIGLLQWCHEQKSDVENWLKNQCNLIISRGDRDTVSCRIKETICYLEGIRCLTPNQKQWLNYIHSVVSNDLNIDSDTCLQFLWKAVGYRNSIPNHRSVTWPVIMDAARASAVRIRPN